MDPVSFAVPFGCTTASRNLLALDLRLPLQKLIWATQQASRSKARKAHANDSPVDLLADLTKTRRRLLEYWIAGELPRLGIGSQQHALLGFLRLISILNFYRGEARGKLITLLRSDCAGPIRDPLELTLFGDDRGIGCVIREWLQA